MSSFLDALRPWVLSMRATQVGITANHYLKSRWGGLGWGGLDWNGKEQKLYVESTRARGYGHSKGNGLPHSGGVGQCQP
jgi:hypothetical protein